MSKVIRTKCDGCGQIGVVVAESMARYYDLQNNDETVDACEDCVASGNYCCRHCRRVHSDENPCEYIRSMAVLADKAAATQHEDIFT
jgi:hypothetical protein